MVFSSYVFLFIFLPVTLGVYYAIPKKYNSAKNIWLLFASLVFYSWNNPVHLSILLLSIILNWLSGIVLNRWTSIRKLLFIVSISLNTGLLIFFKYANFIVSNLSRINPAFGSSWSEIVLPLGISFFTFQGISYVVDVYRGDVETLKNPLDVGLYIAMFPQLVAGPIVRSKTIVTQLLHRSAQVDDIGRGFRRFIYGFAKKIILADTFGMIADGIFPVVSSWNFCTAWIGIFSYTLQIYYDFSGYSDMAIGLGAMFGFHFQENFNYPYISLSITDFWRRWHISLSSWFRDYIYIPCGGSRVTKSRYIFNVLLVWMLTGMWHGANWTFIIWGLYYGLLLLFERLILGAKQQLFPKFIRWMLTFLLVMIGWVFFRSPSVVSAVQYLKVMFSFTFTHSDMTIFMRYIVNYFVFWILGFIGIFPLKNYLVHFGNPPGIRSTTYAVIENLYIAGLLFLSVLYLLSGNYNAFIYFQF